jgi:hypothetical protein
MKMNRFAQVATFVVGVYYLLVTLTMFAKPRWFFENAGHFPPFNRHYIGDTAAFLLPLAVGLLIAARDPVRYRLIIGIGAAASVIHTLNHAYDAVFEEVTHAHELLDFTTLVLLALVLIVVTYRPSGAREVDRGVEHHELGRSS